MTNRGKVPSKIFTLCLLAFCLTGCNRNSQKYSQNTPIKLSKQVLCSTGPSSGSKKTLCVVCSGIGLGPRREAFLEEVKKNLRIDGLEIKAFEPDSDRFETGIEEQSKEVFRKIIKEYKKDIPIVLVGHSQGGLRAYRVALMLKEAGYTVICVATVVTPWQGIALLGDVRRHLTLAYLKSPGGKKLGIKKEIIKRLQNGGQGVADMKPGSNFLKDLHSRLPSNTIPLLRVGAWYEVSDEKQRYAMKRLIGKKEHDTLISLDSQLAKDIEKKNFVDPRTINAHHGYLKFKNKKVESATNPLDAKEKVTSAIKSSAFGEAMQDFILEQLQRAPLG